MIAPRSQEKGGEAVPASGTEGGTDVRKRKNPDPEQLELFDPLQDQAEPDPGPAEKVGE